MIYKCDFFVCFSVTKPPVLPGVDKKALAKAKNNLQVWYNSKGLATALLSKTNKEVISVKNEIKTLSHSTYRCQYHIVFAPKYRRKAIYGELKADIGQILRKLCEEKKVEIIEANAMPDHIHMLVSIPPYLSIAQFVGYIKGKSTLMIFDRHANLKYKYGSRHFWCRGYFVDTVGRNEKAIKEYIKNQIEEDYMADQMTIKEYIDPFTGSKNK
jgi:putative transposase